MFSYILNRILRARFLAAPGHSTPIRLRAENPGREARSNSVPRPSLYCVWIAAHEGENAPLVRVWIDPSMSIFDSQAHGHEPDRAVAGDEAGFALSGKSQSSTLWGRPAASGGFPGCNNLFI